MLNNVYLKVKCPVIFKPLFDGHHHDNYVSKSKRSWKTEKNMLTELNILTIKIYYCILYV